MAKFLGFNIGRTYTPLTQDVSITDGSGNNVYTSLSTSLRPVGKGNLALPHIDKYYTQNGIVKFGQDNLYPQLLNQMYYTSALQGAIINFITNAVVGGGYEWNTLPTSTVDNFELVHFERSNKLQKLIQNLCRDYVIHNRMTVRVSPIGEAEKKTAKFHRFDPSAIRNSLDLQRFIYSSDWSRGSLGIIEYPTYAPTLKTDSLFVYQESSPGQDIYPIPSYNSILNWCFLDGEISFLQKAAIQNAAFPSLIISRPQDFKSKDEAEIFKAGLRDHTTGAENGGRLLVLTGNGKDAIPEVTQITASSTDKQFEITAKELKDNICFAHMINPAIMGIKVAGSLGNAEELRMSYAIFEKNVILPLRNIIEEYINELIFIAGVPNTIKIKNIQIIEGEQGAQATELNSDTDSATGSLAAPRPSVNDHLKGLSAKENSDIYRIVRDYSRDKINEAMAILRLGSYGITEEEAKKILNG